jgi:hypothetical protein
LLVGGSGADISIFQDASSNDDHFSDAPEAIEDTTPAASPDEKAAERTVISPNVPEPTAPDALALDAPQVPTDSTPDLRTSGHNHVPGAFESDEETPEKESEEVMEQQGESVERPEIDAAEPKLDGEEAQVAAASPPIEAPSSNTSDPVSVPSTIVTDVNGEVENNRPESPDIVVKWNEQGDRIPRKVRDETTKIEQMVEVHKARNRTPSPRAAPKRVISGEKKPTNSDLPLRDLSDADLAPASEPQSLSLADLDDMMPPPSPSLLPAPRSPRHRRRSSAASRTRSPSAHSLHPPLSPGAPPSEHGGSVHGSDGGFGDDDFDDFGEEVEGEDFDDFEGFEEGDVNNDFGESQEPQQVFVPEIPVPILDYSTPDAYQDALSDAMNKMFPSDTKERPQPSAVEPRPFLTERRYACYSLHK